MRSVLLLLLLVVCCHGADKHRRDRRAALVYPEPTQLFLILGVSTPLHLERENVIIGSFAKFWYLVPTNSSYYVPPAPPSSSSTTSTTSSTETPTTTVPDLADEEEVVTATTTDTETRRSLRPRSRWSLYKSLGRYLELLDGFGSGRGCVLRAICEAGSVPFDTRSGGLLNQLLQLFLTPSSSSGSSGVAEEHEEERDLEYEEAERAGKRQPRHVGHDDYCHALYPDCRRSLLGVFSVLHDYTGDDDDSHNNDDHDDRQDPGLD